MPDLATVPQPTEDQGETEMTNPTEHLKVMSDAVRNVRRLALQWQKHDDTEQQAGDIFTALSPLVAWEAEHRPTAEATGQHWIEVSENGWTVEHPTNCSLAEFGCSVSLAAEELDGVPVPPGRYEVFVDGIDGRMWVGDVELSEPRCD